MAKTLEQLRSLSDEDLIKEHDQAANFGSVGLSYYREEIARREQERYGLKILDYTKQVWILTIVVTIATVLSLIIALISLLR